MVMRICRMPNSPLIISYRYYCLSIWYHFHGRLVSKHHSFSILTFIPGFLGYFFNTLNAHSQSILIFFSLFGYSSLICLLTQFHNESICTRKNYLLRRLIPIAGNLLCFPPHVIELISLSKMLHSSDHFDISKTVCNMQIILIGVIFIILLRYYFSLRLLFSFLTNLTAFMIILSILYLFFILREQEYSI